MWTHFEINVKPLYTAGLIFQYWLRIRDLSCQINRSMQNALEWGLLQPVLFRPLKTIGFQKTTEGQELAGQRRKILGHVHV